MRLLILQPNGWIEYRTIKHRRHDKTEMSNMIDILKVLKLHEYKIQYFYWTFLIEYGIKQFKNRFAFALQFLKSLVFLSCTVMSRFGGSR